MCRESSGSCSASIRVNPRPSGAMTFFDHLQISIAVILLCVIATKAIYLRVVTGINPIVIGRGKGAWRILEILSLGSLVLWITEVLLHALHSGYDIFPQNVNVALLSATAVKIVGLALVSLGLNTFILAFLSFGNSWRIGIDRQKPGTLVTKGIFSITRNPIYLAFDLLSFGMFLMNGTWFFLIFASLAGLGCHFQILREEEFLRRQYGQDFAEYCRRTARYLIW
jgi:protein-S-isoprenylcysteine O-methyltransferase Ste14